MESSAMTPAVWENVLAIASHFDLGGTPARLKELTAGNINMTYRLDMGDGPDSPRYVLQRINTDAFKDPAGLMENIRLVTEHLCRRYEKEGVDPTRRVLRFVKADNGTLLYTAPDGGAWRAYRYVDGVTAYNSIESAEIFREAGVGFGQFQSLLCDFPAEQLCETIPAFHNTARRYEAFSAAVKADVAHRAADVAEEIAQLCRRAALSDAIVSRLGKDLPLRVTHNDTKLNNVLIDNESGRALCIIDLDTVMPGSPLYDFGDAIRFGAATAAEDEPDLSLMGMDMDLFCAFATGFLSVTSEALTPAEILALPTGALVMTYESALRFLTDYLCGDTYFKTAYPTHNLVRARAQIKLLTEMEALLSDMEAFVARFIQK